MPLLSAAMEQTIGPTDRRLALAGDIARNVRSCWKSLALTAISFKLITFVALTPLVSVFYHGLLAISGSPVMADLDILFFLLSPAGWACAIVVGALLLAIVALEQASLMWILESGLAGKDLGTMSALQFAMIKAVPVVRVTIRVVAWALLTVAPGAILAGVVYLLLLTEYDINYYLTERPPAFVAALVVGVLIVVTLTALVLRLLVRWFFALPLILLEEVEPYEALKLSATRTRGHGRAILLWVVAWVLVTTVLSALATGCVGVIGRAVVPESTNSLDLLAVTIGLTLLLWAAANLAINLISSTTFAAMMVTLYHACGERVPTRAVASWETSPLMLVLTPRRVLVGGILGVLVAGGVGAAAIQGIQLDDHVKIMAHRGSSQVAPENTLAAIRQAIEDEADWVEIDVQETADGEVVLFHDSDFMKLAGVDLKIWNATMADLQQIDVGSWFSPEFAQERVPTLAEVLAECKGKIGVNIELKYYGHEQELERRVADIVDESGMASDIMVMSLKVEGVKKMKAIRPEWQVGLLMSVTAGSLNRLEADFFAVNARFADRALVRAAHSTGREVYVWTVNDAATMSTMISRGVDGLLTDRPDLARSVLQQRAQMTVPERLIMEFAGVLGSTPQFGEP